MIDFNMLNAARVHTSPYSYLLADGVLSQEQAAQIRRDYPSEIKKPGFLPLSKLAPRGAFKALIDDLQSVQLAKLLSDKFDVDLTDKPYIITVRRLSQRSDGGIHRDSRSKILTLLVYLNADWGDDGAGALRVLNGPDDFEDYEEEVPPVAGNVFAFLRSDDSWHGFLPFTGERYVVQMAFLTSQEELDRKEKRGTLQMLLKNLNPFQ
ncbi:MAG: 2OG-Fe(II) oxygenase [Robiginitomaculum sp.]|nr:2OG-Fe(II) oxygenase [Robiginitomaculum sp.]MDQ7078390.1 2OG-Fe(II) oxygenase [Robiginitomaculum sp.]